MSPVFQSPILHQVAKQAMERLAEAGPRGVTVRELAESIGANVSSMANVVRGASARCGAGSFERCGSRAQARIRRPVDGSRP